ncbi:MAG: hypothetical protein JOZ54_14735 [Acidobacteria bacterium]|nr:hypothetical protein [Acidobacteriota bacterium]
MFNFKKFGVAAVVAMMGAASAMASNFRGADQVYVPAAGHLAGASGTFISDVYISNLTDDRVTVSVNFVQGASGGQSTFNNAFTLAPRERREFVDFVGVQLNLASGFGQLIFSGCKESTDCGPATQDIYGFSPNFRNISVESRIYSIPAGTTLAQNPPTTGQLFAGLPWYSFISQDQAANGLDKIFITGIRQNGGAGTAGTSRSNIGFANASQFSTTTIVVKLFNGATGAQIGNEFTQVLSPLGHAQVNLTTMFPGVNGTNFYATVEQRNSTPTGDQPDTCKPNGCPAFFAYGSVLDNASGDATTLEAQYSKPLSDNQIACIYNPSNASCKNVQSIRRAAKHIF